jgi:hypothetical protein
MTFWYGSGCADPCLWHKDPDPDPAIFFCFFKVHIHFFKIKNKVIKKSQVGIKGFLTLSA